MEKPSPPQPPTGFKLRPPSSAIHEAQHPADGLRLPDPTHILAQAAASCFDSVTGEDAAPISAAAMCKSAVCPDQAWHLPQAVGVVFWEQPEVPLAPATVACHITKVFDPAAQERLPELAMNPMLSLGHLAEAAELVAGQASPLATKRKAAKRAAETIGAYAAELGLGAPHEGKWGGAAPSKPSSAIKTHSPRKRGRQVLPDPQVTAAQPGMLMGKYPETMADSAIAVKEGVCRTTVWRRRQKELANQKLSGAKPDRNVSWGHDLAMMGSRIAGRQAAKAVKNRPRLQKRVGSEEV